MITHLALGYERVVHAWRVDENMLWLNTVAILVASAQLMNRPLRPATVCDVLSDLESYSGKIVAVRGRWVASDEGRWLAGQECREQLVTEGFVWPDLIHLRESTKVFDQRLAVFLENPGRSTTESTLAELRQKGIVGICLTAIGRLETRPKLEVVPGGNGKLRGYGFGHLNAAPAELHFQVLRDAAQCP